MWWVPSIHGHLSLTFKPSESLINYPQVQRRSDWWSTYMQDFDASICDHTLLVWKKCVVIICCKEYISVKIENVWWECPLTHHINIVLQHAPGTHTVLCLNLYLAELTDHLSTCNGHHSAPFLQPNSSTLSDVFLESNILAIMLIHLVWLSFLFTYTCSQTFQHNQMSSEAF